jgi:hypothetical protein
MKNHLKEEIFLPPKLEPYEEDANEIICYYDISSKYGIGYLLSNGSSGVAFNDETSLTETSSSLLYYHKRQLTTVDS